MGKCSDRNKFEMLFYASRSISDLGRKLGYKLKDGKCPGGVSQIVSRYIDVYGLDKNYLLGQGWASGKTRETDSSIARMADKQELPWDKAFAFGSQIHNQKLLKRLVRVGKKKYECEKCKLHKWQDENIVLELHHINGIHHDNREKNLQILCPNCHSQGERLNEKAKRVKCEQQRQQRQKLNAAFTLKFKPVKKCTDCSRSIGKGSKTGRCLECAHKHRRKTERPSKRVLEWMIKEKSWTALGKEFGVSDNAVRKWARAYGILTPTWRGRKNGKTNS